METISCEIKRRLERITSEAFAISSKRLKRNGLVTWTEFPTQPIGVEIAITQLTRSLLMPSEALCAWGLGIGPAADAANAFDDAGSAREAD